MAFLNVDPTPLMLPGFARVLVQGKPKFTRVDMVVVTITDLPPGEIPFAEVRNIILGLLEGQYELRVMDIQRCLFHRAQAYVQMNRVTDRDALVHHSPHQFQGLDIEVVNHNRGPNARRVLFNRECWLVLIGYPIDTRNVEDIRDTIRLIMKARVTDLEDVPHYIMLTKGDDFEGVSITVQCKIIQRNLLGGQLQDENIPPPSVEDNFIFPGIGPMQIPTDWVAFFVMMLMSLAHFEWAKNFLNSQVWRFMLSCSTTFSTLSFAIPASYPVGEELKCISYNNSNMVANSSSSQQGSKNITPQVEIEVRRSPRIRNRNEGFKHSSYDNRNCLACVATPPTLPTKTMKNIGSDFCRISSDVLTDDNLNNKGRSKQEIGSQKFTRKIISSKKEKAKKKIEDAEIQEPLKKPKN
uniref:DUF7597 domain-containing protein n=1 Tax=Setaria viridis TaxID=4556 RepID=A0A4U6TBG6_SETVI|nr:hypothetical protein SEVIR_8G040100v2 [Setaria viridis]